MNDRIKITFFFLLVCAGVGLRLAFRDVPNFAPVAALALFAGFYFQSLWIAAMVPVMVLSLTNLILGGYDSWLVMFSVYACLILPAFLGRKFMAGRKSVSPLRMVGLTLSGSILFFLVTNYASFVYWYPQTWSGLMECYIAAIPFFRYTLAGDLFFTFTFFAAHAFLTRFVLQPQVQMGRISLAE